MRSGRRTVSRADRIQNVEDDLSGMPHVILSQARVHDFYFENMRNSPRRLVPAYHRALIGLTRMTEKIDQFANQTVGDNS